MKYIKQYEEHATVTTNRIKEQFRDILFEYFSKYVKHVKKSPSYRHMFYIKDVGQFETYKVKNLLMIDIRIYYYDFSHRYVDEELKRVVEIIETLFDILISYFESKNLFTSTGSPRSDFYQKRYIFKVSELDKISDAVKELIKFGKVRKEIEVRMMAKKYNL
jgi:hypothetical protein